MRRAFVLIGLGAAAILAGVAWLAAAQFGGGEKTPLAPMRAEAPTPIKVDLNQAGVEELGRLPGITPSLAERIARNRPYRKLDDLVTKLNTGEGTMGQLLKDKQLYENMNKTVGEFQSLLAEIKKDPKKYLSVKVSIW